MKQLFFLAVLYLFQNPLLAQVIGSPFSHESIVKKHIELNSDFEIEQEQTESQLQNIIQELRAEIPQRKSSKYVIPVVMHVFHWGDDGKMDMDQALSAV